MIIFIRLAAKATASSSQMLESLQLVAAAATPLPEGYEEAKAACRAKCEAALKVLDGLNLRALSMPELRAAYPRELRVFYKLAERENGTTRVLCEEWKWGTLAFARFLRDVGPSPGPDWKLRRIDQADPLYAAHTLHWVRRGDLNRRRSEP